MRGQWQAGRGRWLEAVTQNSGRREQRSSQARQDRRQKSRPKDRLYNRRRNPPHLRRPCYRSDALRAWTQQTAPPRRITGTRGRSAGAPGRLPDNHPLPRRGDRTAPRRGQRARRSRRKGDRRALSLSLRQRSGTIRRHRLARGRAALRNRSPALAAGRSTV